MKTQILHSSGNLILVLFVLITALLFTLNVNAQRVAGVTGNWSNTATWGGSPVPTSAETVTINTGVIVTVDQAAACASITINAPAANNGITISGTYTLAVTGAITMNAPSAGTITSTIAVGSGTLTAASIAIPGSGTANRFCTVSVSTGTITTTGNITFSGTAAQARLTFTGAGTLNLGGNLSSGGTFAASTGIVNCNGSVAQTVAGYTYNVLKSNNTAGVSLVAATTITTLTIADVNSGSAFNDGGFAVTTATTLNLNSGTYNCTAATFPWGTLNAGTGTVNYALGGAQTVAAKSYYNLTLTGSGTKTTGGIVSVGGNLDVGTSATFATGATNTWTLTVTGTTSVTGTLTLANTGNKTFTGNVTINAGGTWNETGAAAIGFAGNLTNNATAFTASTGNHTFSGASKTLSGSTAIVIPTATFTGSYANSGTLTSATLLTVTSPAVLTNNGTITATTALSGTGELLQGATGILNIGGTSGITALTATTAGNTVNYNGTAQVVNATTYSNLTLSTSGAKTFPTGTTTVNGILSMEGTATTTLTGTLTYGSAATLQYKGSSAQTTGGEFPATFSATGGVVINNSNGVILGSSGTISSLLTFTSGKITTNANVLSLGSGATVSGAGAGKYVFGNLLWSIPNTGSPSRTFNIGDASIYAPVTIDFHNMTGTAGTLSGYTTSGDHASIGSSNINPSKSVNRTWTFTATGLAFKDYDATFTFVAGDIDAGASTSGFGVRKFTSSEWSAPSQDGPALATSTKAIGFTAFSAFQIGEVTLRHQRILGSGAFTVPSGITSIDVECWGGGGAGGGATGNAAAGGGGAGGSYVKSTLAVTPGATYPLVVGGYKQSTTTSTQAQNTGDPTWFGSTTTLYAQGGQGGTPVSANNTNGAAGSGSTASSIGTTKYAGGNGAAGIYTSGTPGGAGGGGAGSSGAGGNASTGTGGSGTLLYGGNGATGVANSTAGGTGYYYAGGGSGGKANSATDVAGGTGAQGLVVVTWTAVSANLQITKSVNNPTPVYGSNVIFTLTASNAGPGNATSVNMSDLLPGGYFYLSHSAPGTTTYNPVTGVWNIGTLNNGASLTLTITAEVLCNGNYTNIAYISGNEPDQDNNNNTASVSTTPTGTLCPLVAVDDYATTFQGTAVVINALSNDHGNIVPGSTIIVTNPQNGNLQNNNGVFTYTPNPSFTGTDQFVYRIFDNSAPTPQQDDAIVTITVESNYVDPCYEAIRLHTYYLPFPENETQLAVALYDASTPEAAILNNTYIKTVVSIKSPYPKVRIIYDQWEDGYEKDITVPAQSTTQVWGDGNLNNGIAPGYPTDIIPAGGSIVLDNTFQYKPRNSANIYYDGRDKIMSTQDIAISKVTGDNIMFNLQCAKTDVYDINRFAKAFTIGLGENLAGTPTGVTAFNYSCLFIRAANDGTTVSLDYNGDGTVDLTKNLNEGEVWFYEGPAATTNGTGDITTGATVTATKPVGVDILFGGRDAYGTRNFNILPNNYYSNTYYSSVPTVSSTHPAIVYFYNPNNFSITINWTSGGGSPSSGTVTLTSKSNGYLTLSNAYGYKFQSELISGSRPTYVASEVLDCPNGSGSSFDWAFPLIAEERLTNFTSIAWAPGAGDVPISRNDNPLWITPVENTTIYIKRDGNLTTTGPNTSPCNLPYDTAVNLSALQFFRWRDYIDKDQSGTALYTCNGTALNGVPFAAVYGEDASTATASNPSLDVGTIMVPRCLSHFIIANDDFEETQPNTPIIIGVSSNDLGFLCSINPISITTTGLLQPANGTIVQNPDGTITYTPNPGFTGVDVFEYSICSLEYPNICDVATVTVTVAACTAESSENLINGKVFVDRYPYNGTLDPGEIYAAGVEVDLYGDIDCNGQIGSGEIQEQSLITDLSGNYQFTTYNGYNAKDNFDPTASYSGNDGLVPWSTNWVEQGDDGVINTGDVQILSDNAAGASGNAIRLDGPDNGISRTLVFSGATKSILRFSYRRQSLLNNGASLFIQINGNILYVVDDGNGVGTDNYYQKIEINIPPVNFNANSSNTLLFLTSSGLTTAEYYYIDNVELDYFSGQTCFITKVNPSTSNGVYDVSPGGGTTAIAGFTSLGECDNGNNLAVKSIKTDLSVTKTDYTGSYGPGNNTVYTVVIYNAGPADVISATISDPVPAGTTITGWTATFSGGATGNSSGGSGPLSEPVNIPVYGSITYLITVAIPCSKTGSLVNTATVSPPSGVTDNDPSNNSSTDTDVQNIWIGYNSTDWNDPGNWSIGVPSCTPAVNAMIPYPVSSGRYPVINSNGNTTSHLLIQNGATLTINPGKDLTVCGCTEIDGLCGLKLRSNPSGNANFLPQGTVTYNTGGSVCAELYLSRPDTVVGHPCRGCWHYVSPPVANSISRVFENDYMRYWTENYTGSTGWSDYITSMDYPLNVMQGYAVSRPGTSNPVPQFNGQIYEPPKSKSLTRTVGKGYGYNLVGNPYTTYLDLGSSGVIWTDVDQKAWYYSQLKGNYNVYIVGGSSTGTRYAPSMQGFFVHVSEFKNGSPNYSGTLTFDGSARVVSGDTTFYKAWGADELWMTVQKEDDFFFDNAIVNFRPDATEAYDNNLDGNKMWGNEEAPQLYTVTPDSTYLTVNSLDYTGDQTIIPLNLEVRANGTGSYQMVFNGMETFRPGVNIILEDKKLNSNREIMTNPSYSFNYTEGDDPARFLLHFHNPFFGIEGAKKDHDLVIYSYGIDVYLKDLTGNPEKGDLYLYNQMGQEISHKLVAGITLNKFTFDLPDGYYIVKVITKERTYNAKVYLD
jgi:uncharacterized repeat protein (TIGR01451 family)